MATAIRNSMTDNSVKDNTNDAINGTEVDANPNAIADILDGTTDIQLGGAASLDFEAIRVRETANAAASVQTAWTYEWDPADGGNMTDTSSGLGMVFKMPDDADVQNDFARINVICLADAAGAEDARMDFYLADTSGAPVSQIQLANGILQPTTDSDVSLGVTGNRWSNLFTDAATVGGTLSSGAITSSGVITGTTIEATGDTSSGDNAAIGYTSAEGLILTGQGSTSDVTLKNDADTTVFTVPTGTDDILFPDSAKGMWGASSDLTVYHDGTNSYITNSEGALKIATETSGIAVTIGHSTSEVTVADNLTVTGALDLNGSLQLDATLTVGVDDTGYDVKFFGAGAGAFLLYDETNNSLEVRGATAAGTGTLNLTTGETTVVEGNILGRINFQAPLDGAGTDAILVGASIWAEADDTFSASLNDTDLVFAVAESETALERMRLSYDGTDVALTFTGGDLTLTASGGDISFGNENLSTTGTLASGALTVTGDILSSSDGSSDLGTTSVRWDNLYTDNIGDSGQLLIVKAPQIAYAAAGIITTASGALTITPTTDTHFTNGTGVVIGHTAQLTIGGQTMETQILGTGNADSRVGIANFSAGANGPTLGFLKSRDASIGGSTIVQDNDICMQLVSYVDDGADYASYIGRILFEVDDATPAENGTGGALVFETTTVTGESSTEALRIDSSQNVLIPAGDLTLNDNGNVTFGTGGDADMYYNGSNLILDTAVAGSGTFVLQGSRDGQQMQLANNHASTPSGLLFQFNNAAPDNNTQFFLRGDDSTTTRIIIHSDGDLANHDGTYGTISDVKFKQDIVPARSYWDDFKALEYVKWKDKEDVALKGDDAQYRIGLIAQDTELVFPSCVSESPEYEDVEVDVPAETAEKEVMAATYDEDGNELTPAIFETVEISPATTNTENRPTGASFKWVKSSVIEGPILAKVVQELQARVEALEAA